MSKTPEEHLAKVREKLGHVVFEWKEDAWLETGVPELNQVFGDPGQGIPYGRIIEIAGMESVGKSALCFSIAALAQAEGASVIWIDFENSWSNKWATLRGLDISKVAVVRPYIGNFGKEKEPRMTNAEELCSQAEAMIPLLSKKGSRIVMVLDSVAAMVPKEKANTALEDVNMRTGQSLPKLLNAVFGRWVGLAQAHNVMILAINQLRQNPMARFSDPWYTPGGNALRFFCHVRVRVKRMKSGMIMDSRAKKTQIGVQGLIRNVKNKAGGLEKSEVAYKIFFSGTTKFMAAKDLEDQEADE